MAVLHFAYSFDPIAFAQSIGNAAVEGGEDLLLSLRGRARATISQPSATLAEALKAVRYDPAWVDPDSQEADQLAKTFMLCLLGHCLPAISLGRASDPPHHLVLRPMLADAGWSQFDINALLRGTPLSDYAAQAGVGLAPCAQSALDDLGGWLGFERATTLKEMLASTADYFADETGRHESTLAQIYPPWKINAGEIANQAYLAASAMLDQVNDRHRALLLILD